MPETTYRLYRLSDQLTRRLRLDPVPFPVRAEGAESIFESGSVSLDAVLDELDHFCTEHPETAKAYRSTAARLAMICATRHAFKGHFASALTALSRGLRADPAHSGLKVHQALALQINGYAEAAAMEYEELLRRAPHGDDPLVRALAAKAFAETGDYQKALEILAALPDRVFQDSPLKKLRDTLRSRANEPVLNSADHDLDRASPTNATTQAQSADGPPEAQQNFCSGCGHKLKSGANFCTHCGQAIP